MPNSPTSFDLEPLAHLRRIAEYLQGFRFRFVTEKDLQDGIEAALREGRFSYRREVTISERDRPDFLLDGGVAIEVKIKGSLSELLRQAARYVEHPDVIGILVVGSPHWLPRVPETLCEKPVQSVRLIGSLL